MCFGCQENVRSILPIEWGMVLDVGANVGLFSLLGSKYVGSLGKIFSFEPKSDTFQIFEANIILNDVENVLPQRIPLADMVIPIIMVNPHRNKREYLDALNKDARG